MHAEDHLPAHLGPARRDDHEGCGVRDHRDDTRHNEQRVFWVAVLTTATMAVELVAGYLTGSLALVADGWHMGTHAGALGLSALAYWLARTRAGDRAFVFGTGKVHALAGYTNAVALGFVALWMIVEAIARLLAPEPIRFTEALPVAAIGLAVNLISVWLLHRPGLHHGGRHRGDAHDHAHDHDQVRHDDDHGHSHDQVASEPHATRPGHDHNLRAAYFHVLADALTSILVLVGLGLGLWLGWTFVDALVGLLAGVLIVVWAVGLCRSASAVLLDMAPPRALERRVRAALADLPKVDVADLHLWELGPGRHACVLSLQVAGQADVRAIRAHLLQRVPLSHLTVELWPTSPR